MKTQMMFVRHLPTNTLWKSTKNDYDEKTLQALLSMGEKINELSYLCIYENNNITTYIPKSVLQNSVISIVVSE